MIHPRCWDRYGSRLVLMTNSSSLTRLSGGRSKRFGRRLQLQYPKMGQQLPDPPPSLHLKEMDRMTPLLQGPKDLHLEVPQPLKEMILIHPSLPPISSRLRLHHMLKESLQQIPHSTSSTNPIRRFLNHSGRWSWFLQVFNQYLLA